MMRKEIAFKSKNAHSYDGFCLRTINQSTYSPHAHVNGRPIPRKSKLDWLVDWLSSYFDSVGLDWLFDSVKKGWTLDRIFGFFHFTTKSIIQSTINLPDISRYHTCAWGMSFDWLIVFKQKPSWLQWILTFKAIFLLIINIAILCTGWRFKTKFYPKTTREENQLSCKLICLSQCSTHDG